MLTGAQKLPPLSDRRTAAATVATRHEPRRGCGPCWAVDSVHDDTAPAVLVARDRLDARAGRVFVAVPPGRATCATRGDRRALCDRGRSRSRSLARRGSRQITP